MATPHYSISGISFKEHKPDKPYKPPTHEIFAKLLLPIILALVAIYRRDSTRVLIAFAGVALVGSYYQQIFRSFRTVANRLHDRRVAREYRKQLRNFCREFTDYFDLSTTRGDTLTGIVSRITQRASGLTLAFARIPPIDLFNSHIHWLNQRVQKEKLSKSEFHETVSELTSVVAGYCSFSVYPVFRLFAAELREKLLPDEKSQLNGFHSRYVTSVTAYQKFLKELNQEFRTVPEIPIGLILCDPL